MYTIEKYNNITRINGLPKSELDLDKTLKCGQAFRWNKLKDGAWCGVIGQKVVILGQGVFKDTNTEGLITNLDLELASMLVNYLNLDMNYTEEINKLDLDNYAKEAYEIGKGIHILRQDLFEMMVTFLMSQFNSMHNIAIIVEKLSQKFGNQIETDWFGEKITRYSFPTFYQLKNATEAELLDCSMGFRAGYLLSMLDNLVEYSDWLVLLHQCRYEDALKGLTCFKGIGEKVANCICLFALHHIESFPIDIHIKRIINREYNGNIDISRYGQYAGIIQQYMYYYEAFNKK